MGALHLAAGKIFCIVSHLDGQFGGYTGAGPDKGAPTSEGAGLDPCGDCERPILSRHVPLRSRYGSQDHGGNRGERREGRVASPAIPSARRAH